MSKRKEAVIAVASGKGGTGKTTVAVNLALLLDESTLIDCDVEGANSHIFYEGEPRKIRDVGILKPSFDMEVCTRCGKCADFCRFNAISVAGDKLLFFGELCHGCGGCRMVCPVGAISETTYNIGSINKGGNGTRTLYGGTLNIGEPFGVPIIRELRTLGGKSGVTIVDSPPGTACPAVEAVRDADAVILVTEPTPFGLHDLKLSVDVVRQLGMPFGVVINRDGVGDARTEEYCAAEEIPVLGRIQNDPAIARAYSRGMPVIRELPEYRKVFAGILEKALEMVR